MITMHNVVKRGRTVWDRTLLPDDEYGERVRRARAAMAERGVDVLVAVGHSASYGALTYLSGNVPPLGWMAVVLGREAGPFLVTGGGSRDIPFLSTLTWIADIRTSPSLFSGPAEVLAGAIAEIAEPGAVVALAGSADALAGDADAALREALDAYVCVDGDALLGGLRAVKRPRERLAQECALALARAGVNTALRLWAAGAPDAEALIGAEREARLGGARDVRVLGTLGGRALAPVEGPSQERGEQLALVCAVEYLGYWGLACGESAPGRAARRAVDAMIDAIEVGAPFTVLTEAAVRELPRGREDVALSYGLGGAIGLDLDEAPAAPIADGAVLALRAVTVEDGRLTCASETVELRAGEVVLL